MCKVCGKKTEQEISINSIRFCRPCLYKAIENDMLAEYIPNKGKGDLFFNELTGKVDGAVAFSFPGAEVYFVPLDTVIRLLTHNLKPEEYLTFVNGCPKYSRQAKRDPTEDPLVNHNFYDSSGHALHPMLDLYHDPDEREFL